MTDRFLFTPGRVPVLMSIPHVGTHIPQSQLTRMNTVATVLADTDWHLHRLYAFATELGVHVLQATHSRYVIDLNRAPDGAALYPGADNTELVPTTSFAREALYLPGQLPDASEIAMRIQNYWQPYHQQLQSCLQQLLATHGVAVLFDCHSIASVVPRFFQGRLHDLNLGTANGSSCAADLRDTLMSTLQQQTDYSVILDGRFKGGYITRHYGKPEQGIHAFQMELAQSTYMQESAPYTYLQHQAEKIQPHLHAMLEAVIAWAQQHSTHN